MCKRMCKCIIVDKCVKEFLNRVLTRKVVVNTVPKKDLMIVLPYLPKLSQKQTPPLQFSNCIPD